MITRRPSSALQHRSKPTWLRWPLALGLALAATALMLQGLGSFGLNFLVRPTPERLAAEVVPAHPAEKHPSADTRRLPDSKASKTTAGERGKQSALQQRFDHSANTEARSLAPEAYPAIDRSQSSDSLKPTDASPATSVAQGLASAGQFAKAPSDAAKVPASDHGESAHSEAVSCNRNPLPATPLEFEDDDITHASASARIHIEANGKVNRVDVLEAAPTSHKREITREVSRALLEWNCVGGNGARTALVPIYFNTRERY